MSQNFKKVKTLPVFKATRKEEMEAFDTLPAQVRTLLSNSALKFSSCSIAKAFRQGKYDLEDLPRLIEEGEKKALLDIAMVPIWGDHHPQEIATASGVKTLKDLDL